MPTAGRSRGKLMGRRLKQVLASFARARRLCRWSFFANPVGGERWQQRGATGSMPTADGRDAALSNDRGSGR